MFSIFQKRGINIVGKNIISILIAFLCCSNIFVSANSIEDINGYKSSNKLEYLLDKNSFIPHCNYDVEEIPVAIYTNEQEDEDFYAPWGRTRYIIWALRDYSWMVGNKTYKFQPILLSTNSILDGKLTTDNFDVLLFEPDTANERVFITGFPMLPQNIKLKKYITEFVEQGGGFFGSCGSAEIAGDFQNKPNTFIEKLWKNSCLGISATRVNFNTAIPILTQLVGRGSESVSLLAYIHYSGWNQSRYNINYYAGACLDVFVDCNNPIFDDYLNTKRKIRWIGGYPLLIPATVDRKIEIIARFPDEELSDNSSTSIHHWRYTGGLKGLTKALIFGEGETHWFENLGSFTKTYILAEDWQKEKIVETNLSNKPFMTMEIYPNDNDARIVLISGHPEYNVWWGGHIEETEDDNHNNLFESMYHWVDVTSEDKTLENEFSYNYWIVRRSLAWTAKIPSSDLPPVYGTSEVRDITPYEQSKIFKILGNAQLSDGLISLDLFYRHSSDNISWGPWIEYMTDYDSSDGWSWEFTSPNGSGYYQFYSIRHLQNEYERAHETPPPGPDAIVQVRYDDTYIPTIGGITIEPEKVKQLKVRLYGNNLTIHNWSAKTNKIRFDWEIVQSPDHPYKDFIVFIRIREWQYDSYFPQLLFKWTNTGSVFPANYTWIPSKPLYHWAIPILIPIEEGKGYKTIELETPFNNKEYSIGIWIDYLDIRASPHIFNKTWASLKVYPN